MRADHAATLAELLTLVDERFQAAIRAGIADIERLDKAERMNLEILSAWGEFRWRCASDYGTGVGDDLRTAIDEVPE